MVIGDGVQTIEVIKAVFGNGSIGAAAAGIGDVRLQQSAVTDFVVMMGGSLELKGCWKGLWF